MINPSLNFQAQKISRLIEEQQPQSSSPSSSMEEINLPTDVLIEILKRLPLNSLIRSTCVCKSWFSLLNSPTFLSILATFNLRKSNDNHKLHLFKEGINIHIESSLTKFTVLNSVKMLKQPDFACPVGKKHFVVNSVDGLVCLFDFFSRNPTNAPLILWNPSIGKAIEVPAPNGQVGFTSGGFPKLIFGVGFNSCLNDYMLVRVAYFNGICDSNCTSFLVNVYSVWSGRWRNKGVCSVPHNVTTIRWRGVYLNGVIHWICNVSVNVDGNDRIHRLILTFTLSNEEFGDIKLPKELVDVTNQMLRVVMVPRSCKEVLGVVHTVANVFNLWVMEDYAVRDSWVKLFNIDIGSVIKNDMNIAVLSDHFVLVQTLLGGWVSYDHKTKQIRHLERCLSGGLDYVDVYVESLILLGEQHGVLACEDLQDWKELRRPYPKPRAFGRGKRRKVRATWC